MIAKVVTAGHSFRGLAAYLTQNGRADWIEPRNVPTEDPELASRMMAAIADQQGALKRAAGVSARGRPCNDPVLHLVLSWRDGEKPTREDQTAAADSLLQKLALEKHQAYIVAHTDSAHHHVHVMVNRVSWENGRTRKRGLDKRICSEWASDYERSRKDIQCPRREAVREAREAGRPIPPRPPAQDTPTPSRRGRFSFRREPTPTPPRRNPVETALWRKLYAASLAAGDDQAQARERRREFARILEETRESRKAVEHIVLPPARPPGRSLSELTRETERIHMAAAAAPADVVSMAPAAQTHGAQDAAPERRSRDRDGDGDRERSRQSRQDATKGHRPETAPAAPTAAPSPTPVDDDDIAIDRVSNACPRPEPPGRGQRRGLDRA